MRNFNIKKLVTILTVTTIVSFSAAAIIYFASGGFHNSSMSFKPQNSQDYSINEEKNTKAKDIQEIFVDNSFPDINIKVENTDEIKAHLYGNMTASFKPKLETEINGNKLVIKSSLSHLSFSMFSGNLNLDITIPSSYNHAIEINSSSGKVATLSPLSLSKLKLHVTSGDTSLKDISSEELIIDSSSGTIAGNNINSKDTSFESTSGNMTLKKLTTDNLTMSSSSGTINGDAINSKDTSLNSTSGNIKMTNFKGNVSQKTSSGKVSIAYSEFNNKVKLSSTSGDINLKLPRDAQFKLDSKTTSGDIDCNFPITVQEKAKRGNSLMGTVGSDKNLIEITASSGNVNIFSN